MGTLFAAALSQVADVTLLGHWPAQMEMLRQKGVTVEGRNGRLRTITFPTTTNPLDGPPVDITLLLVKSWQTERAAQEAARWLSPTGIAITLQNGLGNDTVLAQQLGQERVAVGVTAQGATLLAPGRLRHAGAGPTHLSLTTATQTAVFQLANWLNQVNFTAHIVDDVDRLVWKKLIVNTAINPLTALLRQPNGFLLTDRHARRLMLATAQETAVVARALGVGVGDDAQIAADVQHVARATATNRSSMLQDVSRGAPTEIEAICGAVDRNGRLHNLPTPLNGRWRLLLQQTPVPHLTSAQLANYTVKKVEEQS